MLLAARASRVENQDAIDACIVNMLGDPKEVIYFIMVILVVFSLFQEIVKWHYMLLVTLQARAGIQEVHFLPFNPVEKRTAITYIDDKGNWHRASKGAPEQVR